MLDSLSLTEQNTLFFITYFNFLVTRCVTVVLLFFPFGKLAIALISHVAQLCDRP